MLECQLDGHNVVNVVNVALAHCPGQSRVDPLQFIDVRIDHRGGVQLPADVPQIMAAQWRHRVSTVRLKLHQSFTQQGA